MFKTLITFGLGIYTGIYVAQNYQIERVDEPGKLWDKFQKSLEDFTSDKKK